MVPYKEGGGGGGRGGCEGIVDCPAPSITLTS